MSAEVNAAVAEASDIMAKAQATIIPQLESRYPDLKIRPGERRREQSEVIQQLARDALFALLVIYGLLAVVLRSHSQPLMVLVAVPFGLVGAVWAHYFLGLPMTLGSLVVLVALAGLVVNTSLVMVDYINGRRQENRSLITVVKEAGARRFRPIMLTALTTVFGLIPILIEEGVAAAYIKPLTVPLAFGIAFSTLVSLFLVPLCYAVLEDVRGLRRYKQWPGRVEDDRDDDDCSLAKLPARAAHTDKQNEPVPLRPRCPSRRSGEWED